MDDDFFDSIETRLGFSKRIYYGNDQSTPTMTPMLTPQSRMEKSPSILPNHSSQVPMVYAMIRDPKIVDNPNFSSYYSHVHGRFDPPVLIPLHMTEIGMNMDCYLNTVFVSVHYVMANRRCNCRLVVPMGEKKSRRLIASLASFRVESHDDIDGFELGSSTSSPDPILAILEY
ncbi:hypothetical protein ACLOJK_013245 [Asimina triloba]